MPRRIWVFLLAIGALSFAFASSVESNENQNGALKGTKGEVTNKYQHKSFKFPEDSHKPLFLDGGFPGIDPFEGQGNLFDNDLLFSDLFFPSLFFNPKISPPKKTIVITNEFSPFKSGVFPPINDNVIKIKCDNLASSGTSGKPVSEKEVNTNPTDKSKTESPVSKCENSPKGFRSASTNLHSLLHDLQAWHKPPKIANLNVTQKSNQFEVPRRFLREVAGPKRACAMAMKPLIEDLKPTQAHARLLSKSEETTEDGEDGIDNESKNWWADQLTYLALGVTGVFLLLAIIRMIMKTRSEVKKYCMLQVEQI